MGDCDTNGLWAQLWLVLQGTINVLSSSILLFKLIHHTIAVFLLSDNFLLQNIWRSWLWWGLETHRDISFCFIFSPGKGYSALLASLPSFLRLYLLGTRPHLLEIKFLQWLGWPDLLLAARKVFFLHSQAHSKGKGDTFWHPCVVQVLYEQQTHL